MFFDDAFEIAFTRGTGVSRAFARRSIRTQNPNTVNDIQAEFAILGERLADRAFKNLPAKHRRAAYEWQGATVDERRDMLDRLFADLRSSKWRAMHRNAVTSADSISPALPAEYRSWTRGSFQPSCLGLTQMLVGFARAAGAKHVMVNTLVREDEAEWMCHAQSLLRLQSAITARPVGKTARDMSAQIQGGIDETLRIIAENIQDKQAHHCIMLEYAPNEWCLFDPYVGTMVHIMTEDDEGPGAAVAKFEKDFGGIVLTRDPLVSVNPAPLLDRISERMATFYALRSDVAHVSLDMVPSFDDLFPSDPATAASFGDEEREAWEKISEKVKLLISVAISVQSFRVKAAKYARILKGKEPLVRDIREILDESIQNLLEIFGRVLDELARPLGHHLMELVHPTFFLGLATVHHITITTERTADPIILRFSGSQFLLLDCFNHMKEDELGKLILNLETARLLASVPADMIMPELQLQIPTEWRTKWQR